MSDTTRPEGGAATTGSREPPHRPVLRYKPDRSIDPRRNPPAHTLTELTDDHRQVIELMVYGLDEAGTIEGERIEAGYPLTLRQACRAIGVRLRRMRDMHATTLFQAELNRQVTARRNSERPRNLHTVITIRDDPGANTAADRTVRLKACASIEGTDRPSVSVTINNQNNANAQVTPGYVIRLKPEPQPPQIEGDAIDVSPEQQQQP